MIVSIAPLSYTTECNGGPSFNSVSLLVLGLMQFCSYGISREIRKLKRPPPEFYAISKDRNESRIQSLAWVVSLLSSELFCPLFQVECGG